MEEVIKYFESLEERIATLEAEMASLEAELDELKSLPAPEPQVVEKIVEKPVEVIKEVVVEKPVEVIKEVVVEKPVIVAAPIVEPKNEPEVTEPEVPEKQEIQEEQETQETQETQEVLETPTETAEPAHEETVSPKAAIYGKSVTDIRQAISLGDRFLYQRELFGQNAELMQKTLNELNELGSFEEAVAYISRFGWDTESNSYQQFIVTLHRRFG